VGDATGDVTRADADSLGKDGVSVRAMALGWLSRENPATNVRNTAVTSQLVNFFEID
jgi:hypothetical protein